MPPDQLSVPAAAVPVRPKNPGLLPLTAYGVVGSGPGGIGWILPRDDGELRRAKPYIATSRPGPNDCYGCGYGR